MGGEFVLVVVAQVQHGEGDTVGGASGIHRSWAAEAPGVRQFRDQYFQVGRLRLAGSVRPQPGGELCGGCGGVDFRPLRALARLGSPDRQFRRRR
jgi:hypothetical protein